MLPEAPLPGAKSITCYILYFCRIHKMPSVLYKYNGLITETKSSNFSYFLTPFVSKYKTYHWISLSSTFHLKFALWIAYWVWQKLFIEIILELLIIKRMCLNMHLHFLHVYMTWNFQHWLYNQNTNYKRLWRESVSYIIKYQSILIYLFI